MLVRGWFRSSEVNHLQIRVSRWTLTLLFVTEISMCLWCKKQGWGCIFGFDIVILITVVACMLKCTYMYTSNYWQICLILKSLLCHTARVKISLAKGSMRCRNNKIHWALSQSWQIGFKRVLEKCTNRYHNYALTLVLRCVI